mmetsp:Transcript_36400/g.74711  ORF Transcript_36400/g.74711 Transcript_36400/m.74711 type:complete len:86 (-) Transcript_36400:186-443(-)
MPSLSRQGMIDSRAHAPLSILGYSLLTRLASFQTNTCGYHFPPRKPKNILVSFMLPSSEGLARRHTEGLQTLPQRSLAQPLWRKG